MTTAQEPLTGPNSPASFSENKYPVAPVFSGAQPDAAPDRCEFTFSDGRRCRDQRAPVCVHHASRQQRKYDSKVPQDAALEGLQSLCTDLTTATNINRALAQTYLLMAQGRISRKDAVAFGYLTQLLLQTVPGVRSEFVAAFGYHPWEQKLKTSLESSRSDGDDPGPSRGGDANAGHPVNDVGPWGLSRPGNGVERPKSASHEKPADSMSLSRSNQSITPFSSQKEDAPPSPEGVILSESDERRISPTPQQVSSEPSHSASIQSRQDRLTGPDFDRLLRRSLDLLAGKYNATPEGRREAARLNLEIELMKPPDSKPPKGYFGQVVALVRRLRAGKSRSAAPPDLWTNGLGLPIRPTFETPLESDDFGDGRDTESNAVPPQPSVVDSAMYNASAAPSSGPLSQFPAASSGVPPTPTRAAQPVSPSRSRPRRTTPRHTTPRHTTTSHALQESFAPGASEADPDSPKQIGHATDWYAPPSWSKTRLPDPSPSRPENLGRRFRGMSNSAFRRLQHQNSRGFCNAGLQKLAP